MSSKAKKIIGIDLGTTNSCVSVTINGKPEVVENDLGKRTTASVVYASKEGSQDVKFAVGDAAQRNSIKNPDRTFFEIKRYIGKRYSELGEQVNIKMPFSVQKDSKDRILLSTQDGEQFTAEQLSGKILSYLVNCVKEKYGHEFEVDKVVITVPAYFNNAQREATKQAAEIEGLKVARIINEPTAAALSYGYQSKKAGKLAVFDLGGGTFDISILEKTKDSSGDSLDVLATDGVDHLGGADFDNEIVTYVVDEFKKEHSIDLSNNPVSLKRIKEAAEIAKKNLSHSVSTEISLPFIYQQHNFEITLTRSKFERLIESHLDKIIKPCMEALKNAKCLEDRNGKQVCTVDEIILVGGSTRVPAVYEKVKEIFGKEPQRGVNPDEAVAVGAAIQGAILQGDKDVGDILLVDVTPLTLGIETAGGVFHRLIDKNTPIPTKKSQIYTTATDNQPSVVIKVYQGERDIAEHNKLLAQFVLDEIPPAPRGVPQIEVGFDIDSNGILSVRAKDVNTGKENAVTVKDSTQMSKEEIEKMQQEAQKYADEDKKKKDKIDKLNQADQMVYTAENTLKKQEGLSDETKNQIEDKLKHLKEYLETKDIQVEELDKYTQELSEALQKSYEDISKQASNNKKSSEEAAPGSEEEAKEPS